MNSLSTFGIFVVVFFAYNNTPTQGQTFTVDEVVYGNGEKCITNPEVGRSISLTKLPGSSYEIRETVNGKHPKQPWAKFAIKDFHTMILNTVVFGANIGSYQIQFHGVDEAQRLFDLAALNTLRWKRYLYKLTAVYKYDGGRILDNAALSGHTTSVSDTCESDRYIIHTGGPNKSLTPLSAPPMKPFLLWTTKGFNFCDYDERSILLTVLKSVDRTYDHFLVQFKKESDLNEWKEDHKKHCFEKIPKADSDPKVISYFGRVYARSG